MKNRVDVAQNLQDLNYEVCSTNIATTFALRLLILIFRICAIIHQQLVAMLRGFMRFVYSLYPNLIQTLKGLSNISSCFRRFVNIFLSLFPRNCGPSHNNGLPDLKFDLHGIIMIN